MRSRVLLAIVVALFLPAIVVSVPTQLTYTLNKQYVYAVNGVVDSRGSDVTTGDRTPGSAGTLTSTMILEPIKTDGATYTFVMNMFDTVVNVENATDVGQNVGSGPLGYDMYFQQKVTGEIVQIWYDVADTQFYVNIKVASINSFQTSIVGLGAKKIVAESDPVGVHTATVEGAAGTTSALLLSKTFTQNDITRFVDPSLTSKNVNINAVGTVGIHTDGYTTSTSVKLLSILTNAGVTTVAKRAITNSTGFDMNLSSLGTLTHEFQSIQASGYKSLNTNIPSDYAIDTLFGVATRAATFALQQAHTISEPSKKLALILKSTDSLTSDMIATLSRVGKHIKYNPEQAADIVLPFLKNLLRGDEVITDKLFYVLSAADHNQYIFEYGLLSDNEKVRQRAVLACAYLTAPSTEIADALKELSDNDSVAVHVYGIVAGKMEDRRHYKMHIIKNIKEACKSHNNAALISWINAIGNAGPVHPRAVHKIVKLLNHDNASVRMATIYSLRKSLNNPRVVSLLLEVFQNETNPSVAKTAAYVLQEVEFEMVAESDYPFNKSYTKDITIGGKVASAVFSVDLFAGTNFDCNHPTFNYQVSAQAKAVANLFGVSQNAFEALGVYGKDNGQALQDLIQVTVWNDVIYTKQIPSVDCSLHTYPLAHTAPGFSVSHTLWVSVVPVVFAASVSLNLQLSWGWQVCDAQLSAQVQLIPTGTLTIDGSVTVDLLLLRAGLDLSAGFNEDIQPQLYIHGSECEIGFAVEEDANPMDAQFDSYFEWRECKFLFLDCKWGQHNQQTWWQWNRPATHQTLFQQDWKIVQSN